MAGFFSDLGSVVEQLVQCHHLCLHERSFEGNGLPTSTQPEVSAFCQVLQQIESGGCQRTPVTQRPSIRHYLLRLVKGEFRSMEFIGQFTTPKEGQLYIEQAYTTLLPAIAMVNFSAWNS